MTRINLDHSAMTPVLPEVKEAMAAALEIGNPSSIHQEGHRARRALDLGRTQVAALLNASTPEIFFTSCGTESNNWALRGLFLANKRQGNRLIISSIEHPSVLLAAKRLQTEGADVVLLPVDKEGLVSPEDLRQRITKQTALVSVMLANGEVGTVQPVAELAAIAHEQGALFHTDAIAAAGHMPVDVKRLGVDALSLSANQFYGPPGAAALYVKDGVRILPMLEGGGQEQGGRSGSENLPAIIGMGVAAVVSRQRLPQRIERLMRLRDKLRHGLLEQLEGVHVNGSWTSRLPHNLHVCIDGVSSESLVLGLDQEGLAVGLGSACNSKAMRPSHVLKAMGLTDVQAGGAVVFTLGAGAIDDEIEQAVEITAKVAQRLRRVTAMTIRA